MLCIVIRLVCNSFPIFKTYFTTFLGYSVAQMPRNIPVFSQKTGNSAFLSASSCISLCTCFPKGNQCVSVVWMIIFLSPLAFFVTTSTHTHFAALLAIHVRHFLFPPTAAAYREPYIGMLGQEIFTQQKKAPTLSAPWGNLMFAAFTASHLHSCKQLSSFLSWYRYPKSNR